MSTGMSTETQLRERMTAYADTITPTGPDLAGAMANARRQRRTRTAVTAAVGALLLVTAGAAATGLVTEQHRGVTPTLSGPNPVSPLPGLPEITSVGLPSGMVPQGASTQGGVVWALLSSPKSASPQELVHGESGGELTRVPGSAETPLYSDSTVLVSGPRALLVTTDTEKTGDPASSSLTTYDSRTGAVLQHQSFGAGTSADIVSVTGGPTLQHALVVVSPLRGGAASLRISSISAVGDLAPGAAVPVPAADWDALQVPQAASVTLVHDEAGTPRYAYLLNGYGAVPRVDLASGAVQQVSISPDDPQACCLGGAIGEVGGRVLYDTTTGLFAGALNSLAPVRVGSSGESTSVVDGRAYIFRQPDGTTEQELDPTNLQPAGPILTRRPRQGPVVSIDAGQIATSEGVAQDGSGGTLFFFGADVG